MTLPPGLQFERADWVDQAACRGRGITALFFPERGDNRGSAEARAVCAGCPVRQQCLDFALTNREQHGIFGGLTTQQRNRLRRPGIPPRAVATVDHCANGHPWDDYYDHPDGYRKCRHCVRDSTAKWRRAKGIPERGISADGQQLADNVYPIRRPA